MRKYILMTLFLILGTSTLSAQSDTTNYWLTKGNAQLLFNQASFSNWVQGGDNSYSGTALLNYNITYNDSTTIWENVFDFGYGLLSSEENGIRKNEDKIDILSNYNYRAKNQFFYTGKLNFKTQFTEGFNYPNDSIAVSNFLSPAYVILSLGMTYKPNADFSFYLSPATGKMTIVNDKALADSGAYGVERGKKVRIEFGAYATIDYKKEIMENITFKTKLDLFDNYTDPNSTNRDNIDVNWENSLNLTVNKYITVNLFLHLIYDNDISVPLYEKIDGVKTQVGVGPRLQVKQTLGLGFSYKF
ncbi:DUF3078 domain-containing protein [bacterium]|nr:MAG: DUF3078 domain-containing protein [bacterium]